MIKITCKYNTILNLWKTPKHFIDKFWINKLKCSMQIIL